jgi:hypothetical protein
MEELNIDVNTTSYKHLGCLKPHQHNTSAFMQVYLISTNVVPRYNINDFTEYLWLKPEELLERLRNGDKSKDDLPKIVEILF